VNHPTYASRREFLHRSGAGCGTLALAALLEQEGLLGPVAHAAETLPSTASQRNPLASRPGHFSAKAKSVIWLFMQGAPSQVDTWDYKPQLALRHGQELNGFDQSTGFFAGAAGPIMKSPFQFRQHGETGTWVSEIFPNLARHVDDMAFIYSCYAHENNHAPAQFEMNTGMSRMGFPCLGSWVTYGLGTENQDLPGFIVMYDNLGRGVPKGRAPCWGAGFLPAVLQGTALNAQGPPIDNLVRGKTMTPDGQRAQLDFIQRLNRRHLERNAAEADLAARIESFELAYRMQVAAPDALDLSRESRSTRELYGLDNPRCAHFGKQTLMARRLVERGVRFIQIYSGGFGDGKVNWDAHKDLETNHRKFAGETELPIAALITDLKQRGLFDSTLVVCCGEFGRLPLIQNGGTGRDHNPHAFTTWLAGGGAKRGASYGKTDELGNKVVEKPVSINDLHATVLHVLGMDHEQLTYRYNGRDFRLTDVAGRVVENALN
jgi:hypothetical protein